MLFTTDEEFDYNHSDIDYRMNVSLPYEFALFLLTVCAN